MLSYVVHCSLKGLDGGVVPSDGHSVLDDVLSHVCLLVTQLIHYETKVGVDLVVSSKGFIHVVRVHFQLHNFLLAGSDGTFQLLNFEIQNVFELLQLLGLLFEHVNLLLLFLDVVICNFDLSSLV